MNSNKQFTDWCLTNDEEFQIEQLVWPVWSAFSWALEDESRAVISSEISKEWPCKWGFFGQGFVQNDAVSLSIPKVWPKF